MNRWGIPAWLEDEIRQRDKTCIYCGVQMVEKRAPGGSRKSVATWEHIINDASIVTRDNIARCCCACNSSKGTKELAEWLGSKYCKIHDINADTVAEVAKRALIPVKKLTSNERKK
ncbi:MAG: HNH endonuclease [Deltaproteobacteria bacterium]|nr:HNH endonuclease [Deltaproteobacteria bacterium]